MSTTPATAPSANTILINLLTDLNNSAHLKSLLSGPEGAVLQIATELAQYAAQPVQAAVAAAPATITLSKAANWKMANGAVFSLTPEATCTVAVAAAGTGFTVAKSVDTDETQVVSAGPADGKVYVNIEMDFSIAGSGSGSGTVSGVGISGKASGSAAATLSYCHAVDATMTTEAALKEAFNTLAFPFQPDCALKMAPGDAGRVSFDGSLAFGLGVTYGLGPYRFSAPGTAAVQQALQKGFETLTLPTATVNVGVTANGSYTHADHFTAIVLKTSAAEATLYLARSSSDEIGAGVGVDVGIKVTPLSATLNETALANAVSSVTGSKSAAVAGLASEVQESLLSRTNHYLSMGNGDITLMAQLGRQKQRALLYEFQADLTQPDVLQQSWEKLAEADVAAAMQLGGLKLLPGSGVTAAVQRSVSVGLHFFNFASATQKDIYFQNASTVVGPDGSIRYLFDVGKERDTATKHTLASSRVHFMAEATSVNPQTLTGVDVKLVAELSETNKAKDGKTIATALGALPGVTATVSQMGAFVDASPKNHQLTLMVVLEPAAYGRLSGAQDQANWQAFHDAVVAMDGTIGPRIVNLGYQDWALFNLYAVNGDPPSGTPNRLQIGNTAAVPDTFYADRGWSGGLGALLAYFLVASQRTMNLFDGLNALATQVKAVDTPAEWDALLQNLTALAKDLNSDWTRPLVRALLAQCGVGATVAADAVTEGTAMTCTVTLS